jgi:Zn-dependent protease
MLGADLRIRPLFWASCLLPGVVYYQDPINGGAAMFSFWIAAVVASLLVHEIGHILAARAFGVRPRIVLSGLGGQLFGLDEMKRWQRLLTLLAGVVGNVLILTVMWLVTIKPLPDELSLQWRGFLANAAHALMMINALWALLNLLPLWPLDGGRIAVELGTALLGRRGQTLALLLSLAVSVLLMLSVVMWLRVTLIYQFDDYYRVYLEFFCIQAIYCYAFWLSSFRALWGDPEPLDESVKSERAA